MRTPVRKSKTSHPTHRLLAAQAHMAQGDSELDGTGIETSITGDFKITLIKAAALEPWQQGLDFPMGETDSHWIVHSFTEIDYLETYAANPGDIYGASSIDDAAKNTFTPVWKSTSESGLMAWRSTRRFRTNAP